jgi:hypothetical protein
LPSRRWLLAEHAHGNAFSDAPHHGPVGVLCVTGRRIRVLLVILQQPAAPGRRYRHAILIPAIELDLDAERIRQISGLVDSFPGGDQLSTCQPPSGGRRDLALVVLKPGKTVPVLRTDSRDQLGIHAHALSQTTDMRRLLNLIDSNSGSER